VPSEPEIELAHHFGGVEADAAPAAPPLSNSIARRIGGVSALGPVIVRTCGSGTYGTDTDTSTAAHNSSVMNGSGMDAADAGTTTAGATARGCFSGNARNANDGRCGERSDCSIGHWVSFPVSGVEGCLYHPHARVH
jgi:hypothetical protein